MPSVLEDFRETEPIEMNNEQDPFLNHIGTGNYIGLSPVTEETSVSFSTLAKWTTNNFSSSRPYCNQVMDCDLEEVCKDHDTKTESYYGNSVKKRVLIWLQELTKSDKHVPTTDSNCPRYHKETFESELQILALIQSEFAPSVSHYYSNISRFQNTFLEKLINFRQSTEFTPRHSVKKRSKPAQYEKNRFFR